MYKQYIVGFMMIEGIVLELDVERIQSHLTIISKSKHHVVLKN